MLISSAIVDFYFFYDWGVDMQIWALLTRSQCCLWYSGDLKGLWASCFLYYFCFISRIYGLPKHACISTEVFFFFFRFVWGAHEVCGSHCHFGHQCQHPVHWFWGAFGRRIHQEDPSSDQTKTIGLSRVSQKNKLYIEIKNARNKLFLHNFIYCGIIIFCGGLMFLDLVGVLLPTNLRPKECLTN